MSDAPELSEIMQQQPQQNISAEALQQVFAEFGMTKLALAEANVRIAHMAAENQQLREAGRKLLEESTQTSENGAVMDVVPMRRK